MFLNKFEFINNNIIAVGGYFVKFVEEYDFMKQKWFAFPNTIECHTLCGIYIWNNIIYVFGDGGSGGGKFGILEKFDTREKKWSKIDELSTLFNFNDNDCKKKRYFNSVLYVK